MLSPEAPSVNLLHGSRRGRDEWTAANAESMKQIAHAGDREEFPTLPREPARPPHGLPTISGSRPVGTLVCGRISRRRSNARSLSMAYA
jgi:hypothetical protein